MPCELFSLKYMYVEVHGMEDHLGHHVLHNLQRLKVLFLFCHFLCVFHIFPHFVYST